MNSLVRIEPFLDFFSVITEIVQLSFFGKKIEDYGLIWSILGLIYYFLNIFAQFELS
jgi:hypothetical protein